MLPAPRRTIRNSRFPTSSLISHNTGGLVITHRLTNDPARIARNTHEKADFTPATFQDATRAPPHSAGIGVNQIRSSILPVSGPV